MPGGWGEEPDGATETLATGPLATGPRETEILESPPVRRGPRATVALAAAAGLLAGVVGTHEVQRRQAEGRQRSGIALYGLFDSAETAVADGRPDVSAGLRVYNAGPLPVTVAGLRLTGSGLAAAGSQSSAPVRVAAHSTSLALALRSDCTGRDGDALAVTASIRTANGRNTRRPIPLDHYSDGYLAVNAACTEARMQAAAPLPDIGVTVRSARVSGAGAHAVLRWQLELDGDAGITVNRLAFAGRRLRLAPVGLPVTFGPTHTAALSAAVLAAPCAPPPLQAGDFLLTWTASRRSGGGRQQRLANISGVPPAVVLATTRYAAEVCRPTR